MKSITFQAPIELYCRIISSIILTNSSYETTTTEPVASITPSSESSGDYEEYSISEYNPSNTTTNTQTGIPTASTYEASGSGDFEFSGDYSI